MAAISSNHSFYLSTLVALSFTAYTHALPFSTSPSFSFSSISVPLSARQHSYHTTPQPAEQYHRRSIQFSTSLRSLPQHLNTLSKRDDNNNVGAAIGPLIGAVVILFALYIVYQRWRKRKDKAYFLKKEGPYRHRSSSALSPSQLKEKEKHAAATSGTHISMVSGTKAVTSGGIFEVKTGASDGPPSPRDLEDFPSRDESRASSQLSVPALSTADKRGSAVSNISTISFSSLSQGMQGPGGAKLSQGANRKVEISHVRRPELARTRAPVRGSEYWSKHSESEGT